MGKKAKRRNGLGRASAHKVDANSLARQAKIAVTRGEFDVACQMLSQVRQSPGTSLDNELYLQAYVGKAYSRWSKPGRALEPLQQALRLAPDRADLRRLHGHVLRRLGRLKPALTELKEARRLAPDDRQLAFETALVGLAAGETDDLANATASLTGAAERRIAALLAVRDRSLPSAERALGAPTAPVDRLMHAVLLLAQHQPARAIPDLEAVRRLEQLPDTIRAYAEFYLGVAYVQRRELPAAVRALENAQTLGTPGSEVKPHLTWAYQQLAIDAVLANDLAGAADWFERLDSLGGQEATAARDNAAHALSLQGQELARVGDYEAAANAWSQALALAPRDFALRQNLAVALERAGRADEAIAHWQELVRQMPSSQQSSSRRRPQDQPGADEDALHSHIRAVAHRPLADLYLDQDEVVRAIEQMERAIRAVPSDVDNRRFLARLLIEEGHTRKAIPHFEQVVAALSDSAEDHLELGLAYASLDAHESGLKHARAAYALEPTNPAARAILGTLLVARTLEQPGAASALDDARQAIALLPPNLSPMGLGALGAAQLASGDRRGGAKTLRRAIKMARDKATALANVGNVWWKAGEPDEAVRCWTEAMENADKNPKLYSVLAEAWAKVGDVVRLQHCLSGCLSRDPDVAIAVVKKMAQTKKTRALLQQALRGIIPETDDPLDRVDLAEMLILAGDVSTARSVLNSAARQAVQMNEATAMDFAIALDMKYRLLDRKTAEAILDWMDSHPIGLGGRLVGGGM